MSHPLDNPRTVAYYAALYEMEQAHRDFSEAFARLRESGARAGSPEDYAVWNAGGYTSAAERLVRALPIWESSPH